jgi:hypothetical protein
MTIINLRRNNPNRVFSGERNNDNCFVFDVRRLDGVVTDASGSSSSSSPDVLVRILDNGGGGGGCSWKDDDLVVSDTGWSACNCSVVSDVDDDTSPV